MSSALYERLSWLPRPPDDYPAQCRAASAVSTGRGSALQALASYALDGNQLHKLARLVRQSFDRGESLTPLMPFRLGIVSNATTDLVVPALYATAPRHGIALQCIAAKFGQTMQEALSPNSAINRGKVDAVLVAIDYRGLPLMDACVSGRDSNNDDEGLVAIQSLQSLQSAIHANSSAQCFLQTVARPPEQLFGNYDAVFPGTIYRAIRILNERLADLATESNDLLIDIGALAETVGLADWHSPAQWNMAKLPFADTFVPLYADHICRAIAALRGKSRRCLVLDLDNTIWGGVVGDDGVDGLKISQGDATGEAYLQVQKYALALRARGVVLAVSSKNTDASARGPFRDHPEMILREEHIAVFQANWNDKATNIRAIADELSLGVDSMVLLDDNPAERGLVRKMLPQVAVPELPDDPALYARTLSAAGYFEAVQYSAEDRKRAQFYQDNARRVSLRAQVGGLQQYLASLDMEIVFQGFDETGRSRVVQLINKSNQFNLTTKRYSEAEIMAIQNHIEYLALQIRLLDIYGDNGMISVVICRRTGLIEWEIDTWLMSCRVLGRGVEVMVLNELLMLAKERGIERLVGIYRPTPRNAVVEAHYQQLGFSLAEKQSDGTTIWHLRVDGTTAKDAPIRVRRVGYALSECPQAV